MDDQAKRDAWSGLAGKSELERTLHAGIQGAPELRGDEKAHYLGEFRERVLVALTRQQAGESVPYQEVEAALKNPRAALMVAHGQLGDKALSKYKKLAQAYGRVVTIRQDASFVGETGLIVAADTAVDLEQVHVEDRRERLLKKGLPEQLIQATGAAICKECWTLLQQRAPEELENYRMLNPISRLFGEKCTGHE
ncbi:MAG: hypothetical protein K0R57_1838 [Paenibacillaceae bacterium]|jgi:uncharacterized protein YueI|nr:hypothetical protein [Paenibacillaceae bacterium]